MLVVSGWPTGRLCGLGVKSPDAIVSDCSSAKSLLLFEIGTVSTGSTHMLARLGDIVYWSACAAAALILALGVFDYLSNLRNRHPAYALLIACVATVVWLVGQTVRYVFRGI